MKIKILEKSTPVKTITPEDVFRVNEKLVSQQKKIKVAVPAPQNEEVITKST